MPAKTKSRTRKRRNLDPLSAMSLAQTTGADKALLGRKGFAALTSKSTYLGRGRNPEDIDFLNTAAPYPSIGHIEFTPDGIERFTRDGFVYQAFSATPVFGDGYRMGTPEASVQDYAMQNPAKYDRCVKAVQESASRTGRPVNAYAVCTAQGLRNARRKNPQGDADSVYEEFHGEPPAETLEYKEQLHVHGHLAGLGDLCHIVVKLTAGTKAGTQLQLNAPDPARAEDGDIVRLTSNEDKSQLYFVGGDQSLDLKGLGFRESFTINHDGESFDATDFKDLMEIGRICRVMYRTEKEFDDFETIDYHHLHGEDTKKYPLLLYDNMNSKMLTAGGEYAVAAEGIVN